MTTMLDVTLIRTDGGTQPRAEINAPRAMEFAQDMERGAIFPPVTVFFDGQCYWLGDGFHRYRATAEFLGLAEIAADVRQGTQRDAVLFSCGANATHGMRRTNEDKQRAVTRLLTDEEWSRWSDRKIAEHCAVSDYMVREWREKLYPSSSSASSAISSQMTRTVQRGGSTYEMATGGINAGRSRPQGTNEAGYSQDSSVGITSSYQPSPEIQPRFAGHRERDYRNPELQIEGTLLAIKNAMAVLPKPHAAAALAPHFDLDTAESFADWWTEFADKLGERAERMA